MGCPSIPMTVIVGRSHSRSWSVVDGSPASCTPGSAPIVRANTSGRSSRPSIGACSADVGARRPSNAPSNAGSPCWSTSEASTSASAITGSGIAPPTMPECCGPSSARSSMSAAARPRSEYVRPGTPTSQLPASARTSASERSSSRWAVKNLCRVGDPISSSPSINTRTLHGGPSPAASHALIA